MPLCHLALELCLSSGLDIWHSGRAEERTGSCWHLAFVFHWGLDIWHSGTDGSEERVALQDVPAVSSPGRETTVMTGKGLGRKEKRGNLVAPLPDLTFGLPGALASCTHESDSLG